ncbi:extracellular solute-binding protein [Halegenticoccus soli]|uniref:extracellular solute-binding protein n=1 Tax=Halegenticoccus soli TaxID=1985678 RepID=UPI00130425B6|nr:extracellular solute-binding protein [Halegenticoccus soli]
MSQSSTPSSSAKAAAVKDRSALISSSSRRRFLRGVGAAGIAGLAGCTGGDGGSKAGKSGGGMEISYWTLLTGGDGEIMVKLIKRFNDEQPLGDVTISRQRVPWDEYYNRLFTAMTSNEAPNLAICHGAYLRRFSDLVVPIGDLMSNTNYVKQILDACTIDDEIRAVPMDSHPVGLYYNEDILKEAGVTNTPFDDFSQFEEACNKIRDETDYTPFGPSPNTGVEHRQYLTSIASLGGKLVETGGDGPKAVFDQGPGLEAAEYYASVSGERKWDIPDTSEDRVNREFLAGNIGFMVHGTWTVNRLRDVDFNWNMMKPYVTPNATQLRTAADSHTLILPDPKMSDERIKTTVKVAEWLTQNNPEWGAEAGHLPAYIPTLESDDLRNAEIWDVTLKDFMEMAQNGQLAYYPQLENFDIYDQTNWTWLLDAYAHNVSPKEAVSNGVQTWNSNL